MPGDVPDNIVRFLLVEDDEDHAELVRRAMRDNRVTNEIIHVRDGEAAMKFLRKQAPYEAARRPDVILLDLNLPRMSGHEVLAALKTERDLKSIPVIALTTSSAESDRNKAYSANVNSYLVKPLDFDTFRKMIRDVQMYWSMWNKPSSVA